MNVSNVTDGGGWNTTEAPEIAGVECDGWHALKLWYYLGPMIFLTVALGFIKKRTRLFPKFLGGRPGVIYPVNFIDEHDRRWAFAAAFGALSYETMDLFFGEMLWDAHIPPDMSFLGVFAVALNVLILCIIFYPLFVCINHGDYLLLNIIGFFIAAIYWGITFYSIDRCDPLDEAEEMRFEGLLQQVVLAPVYLCYLVLVLCFLYDAFLNVRRMCRKQIETEKPVGKQSQSIKYMEALMRRTVSTQKMTLKQRMLYKKVSGLKYSPRVICTMVVAIFFLYRAAVMLGYYIDWLAKIVIDLFEETGLVTVTEFLADELSLAFPQLNSFLNFPIMDLLLSIRYSIILANFLTVLIQTIFIIHMVATYRNNMRKLIQGNHDWHDQLNQSPTAQLLGGIRYCGYQVAYMIYGFLICFTLMSLILLCISILIVVPIVRRVMTSLLSKIISYWPAILISVFIYLAQHLMVRFAFLQQRGAYLALDNRRMYNAMSFILFFFNIMLGLFSCLKRVVLSVIFGTILLPRLDHCLLMRGFERFDSGYLSYMGMLMVDEYHNHPILKAAVEILQERVEKTSYKASDHNPNGDVFTVESGGNQPNQLRRKYVRNRWWKMVTLLNNPTIVLDIAQQEVREQMRRGEKVVSVPMLGLTVDDSLNEKPIQESTKL